MNTSTKKGYCEDCGTSSTSHIQSWLDEFSDRLLPRASLPRWIEVGLDTVLENSFGMLGLVQLVNDFPLSALQMRTACFIEEARERGVHFRAMRGIGGYTNNFLAVANGKTVRFSGLPVANFPGKNAAHVVDNKARVKERLKEYGFPIADGRSFWAWQKEKAVDDGLGLGFPLVVKPCSGSVARHVTTDIKNASDLRNAIDHVLRYSPAFLIERFVEGNVYRATVVDQQGVACVMQRPANVVGDGFLNIFELVEKKNADKMRGETHRTDTPLYKLVVNSTTRALLSEKGYTMKSIPVEGEEIPVQKNPFLKLGGDLVEVTEHMHPDNLKLFKDISQRFDIRLVGIDFIAPDISRSWKEQPSAILELNSVPCIEMHHFPSSGTPQNVAGMLVDMFFKYYV